MTRFRRVCTAAGILLAVPVVALAQTSGVLTFDVPAQRASGGDASLIDQKPSGSASLDYLFASDRGRLFYEMAFDRFDVDGTWATWLHNAGVAGTFAAGKNTSIETGAAVFWRVNTGGWSDAGFNGLTLATSVERRAGAATLVGGYSLHNRRFADAPALDQVEHSGHVRALVNLQSRTTLVGAVSVGRKGYAGETVVRETILTSYAPGQGRGKAWTMPMAQTDQLASARTQFSMTARIAQSLADRTGVWLEHERRHTGGDAPPAVVWTPPAFYDDGVYDDPYAIDAATWRAGAKHVFAGGASISAALSRSIRDFVGVMAIADDEAAGPPRSDRLFRGAVEVVLPVASVPAFDLDAVLGYGYLRNSSNDPFERYRTHLFSAGLRAGF